VSAYTLRYDGASAVFTPDGAAPARVALIVGRPAGDWLGAGSGQPRALVDAGCAVLASDADTVAEIDGLATAAAAFASTAVLWLIGCGPGCAAALEWTATRDQQVAALSLQAPTGVALGTARRYTLRDMLGGASPRPRAQVWHTAADSAAATLASQLGATDALLDNANPTLAAPAPIVAALAAAAASWTHRAAALEKRRWVKQVEATAGVIGRQKTADGHQAVVVPSVGEVWHMFADTGCGTIDVATGTFTSGHFVRNSVVRRDLSGAFVGQIWNGSFTGPAVTDAWIPNQGTFPGHFWWPISGTALDDQGRPVVLAARLTGVATYQGTDVLTINPTTGAVLATAAVDVTDGWVPFDLATHGGYHYVYCEAPGAAGIGVTRAARADLATPARWERWTADGWTNKPGVKHLAMADTAGRAMPAFLVDWTMRSSPYGFLAAGKDTFNALLHIYRAEWPMGPWRPVGTVDVDVDLDGPRFGDDQTWSYIPRWHPHLDTPDDLMLSYAAGYADPPAAASDFWFQQTQFANVPRALAAGGAL
jgi:hypothetical protein